MLRICVSVFLLILAFILILRTLLFPDYQRQVIPCSPEEGADYISVSPETHLARFQEAIKLQTISYNLHRSNTTALLLLLQHIHQSYPVLHSSPWVTLEMFNLSSLYVIQGTDASLLPVLLTGHIDVVPAEREKWSFSPFSGSINNGTIYGRGTIDNKNTVFGILEALEHFLGSGKRLKRTLYFAIGHDEEVLGMYGARVVAEELEKRGIRFAFMLDEGLVVLEEGSFSGYDGPVGLIGIAEKGFSTLELFVRHAGGHSSAPPRDGGAIGILAEAIYKLQQNPIPHMFGKGVEVAMYEHAARSLSPFMRFLSSNLWLFSPIVAAIQSRVDAQRAQITPTLAFTMLESGVKDNVLPYTAKVTVNCRLLPGYTVQHILDHVTRIVDNPEVKVHVVNSNEASSISSTESTGYNLLHFTIKEIFPGAMVLPGLLFGGTDTKHYGRLCDDVYRFAPTLISAENVRKRFHGHDEIMTVKNYAQTINFYYHFLQNLDRSFEAFHHDEL